MEGERSLRAEAQRTLLEYQEGINEFLQSIAGATERAGASVSSDSLLCKEIEGIVAIDKKWQRIIVERLCPFLISNPTVLSNFHHAVERHQKKQKELQQLEARRASYDAKIVDLARELAAAEQTLEFQLEKARKKMDALNTANQSKRLIDIFMVLRLTSSLDKVPADDIIRYAKRISYTTAAPPGWNPPQPLRLFKPPNPQEDMMRSSLLYQSSAAMSRRRPIVAITHATTGSNSTYGL